MSKKLFVGGLPFNVDSSQLEAIFAEIGKVTSCKVITDRDSGDSRGFAFVEMENDKEADEAIKKLNGSTLEDGTLVVNVAKPRRENSGFSNRDRGGFNRRDSRRGTRRGRNSGRGGYRR